MSDNLTLEQRLAEVEGKCPECVDIESLEIDHPDEPHHGGIRICGECEAEYYEEYGGKILAVNERALKNHPLLKLI